MGLAVEGEALLLAQVDLPEPAGGVEADRIVGCFRASGAGWAERSTDATEADALFQARRLAYPALERLGPVLTEDVCVPRRHVPGMLGRIEELARRHQVKIANIAHAGDGNLHPLIITPPGDDAARSRAQSAFEDILDAALELGGTVTGEHGVGLLKRAGLEREVSPAALDLHRAVKTAFDPAGLFNPGKVVSRPAISSGGQFL
jgi:glycolate oxidase